MHVSEKCVKTSCDVRNCNLRHPKVCRYFRDFQFCKFGEWCCFIHISTEIDDRKMNEKHENLEKKR